MTDPGAPRDAGPWVRAATYGPVFRALGVPAAGPDRDALLPYARHLVRAAEQFVLIAPACLRLRRATK